MHSTLTPYKGLVPQSFLDQLQGSVELVDLIEQHGVTLKKQGRDYFGLCPFHNEKSPSFSVNSDKQFFYCFGCGASGDALGFVQEHMNLTFKESVEYLARQQGMALPEPEKPQETQEQKARKKTFAQCLDATSRAALFYRSNLQAAPAAQDYLKGRGISQATLDTFKVGYAFPEWSSLKKHLNQHYLSDAILLESGLLTQTDQGRSYDRFRDRIIFPIQNRKGETVGFGGRVLDDSKPKYINSPESVIYKKSHELYGFYEARKYTRNLRQLLVVEGYMDVLSLFDCGITWSTASSGTALTADQIRILFRATNEVVYCFDGDRAGREAALRACKNALPEMLEGRTLRFLFLEEGEDPDSLVRRIGSQGFSQKADSAIGLVDYIQDQCRINLDLTLTQDQMLYLERLKEYVGLMPDAMPRQLMLVHAAQATGMPLDAVEKMMFSQSKPRVSQPTPNKASADRLPPSRSQRLQLNPAVLLDQVSLLLRLVAQSPSSVLDALDWPVFNDQILYLCEQFQPGQKEVVEMTALRDILHSAYRSRTNAQGQLSAGMLHSYWQGTPHGERLQSALCENSVSSIDSVDLGPISAESQVTEIQKWLSRFVGQMKTQTVTESRQMSLQDRINELKAAKNLVN